MKIQDCRRQSDWQTVGNNKLNLFTGFISENHNSTTSLIRRDWALPISVLHVLSSTYEDTPLRQWKHIRCIRVRCLLSANRLTCSTDYGRQGFRVVGDIEHTGLFRPLDPSLDRLCGKEALLGESALGNFQDMHRHVRPGSYDADLAAMTCYDPPRSG